MIYKTIIMEVLSAIEIKRAIQKEKDRKYAEEYRANNSK
jgi:hypothetical protein